MEQRGLSGARRGNDYTTLALAQRRHQIHDPRGVTVGDRLELDPLVRVDRSQLFERPQSLIFRRFVAVDFVQPDELRTAISATRLAFDPHPVAQAEAPD